MDRNVYRRMAEQEERHWWFHARREIVQSLIERFLPPVAEPILLEVGCGTGGNLQLLSRYGTLDAAEYDPQARAIAQGKSGLPIGFCALPDRIDAAHSHYDLVVLLDVLEHVEDDVASLRALKTKLAPGGRVLLTVPALPWLWSAHDDLHHHFRRYTETTLRQRAEAAGLRVLAAGYFNSLLLPLVVSVRVAKKALGIHSSDDTMPGATANAVLRNVFRLERKLVGRVRLPLGSSLFLVAE